MKPLAITDIGAYLPPGQDWEDSFQMLLTGKSAVQEVKEYKLPIDVTGYAAGIQQLDRNFKYINNHYEGAFLNLIDCIYPKIANYPLSKGANLYVASTHIESDILANLIEINGNLRGIFCEKRKNILLSLFEIIFKSEAPVEISFSDEEKRLFSSLVLCSSINSFIHRFPFINKSFTSLSACVASLHAVQQAFDDINLSDCQQALVIGIDALSIIGIVGFQNSRAASKDGITLPFGKTSKGMLVGEGACYMILDKNAGNGKKALGHIYGVGVSCDARHPVEPDPEGAGLAQAMQQAITQAGIDKRDIVAIVGHGTGTAQNDMAEIKAIKSIFNEYVPPITSVKHVFGHTMGAAGLVNILTAITARLHAKLPPISDIPYESMLDSSIVKNKPINIKPDGFIIVNALGFGGNNASVVVGP